MRWWRWPQLDRIEAKLDRVLRQGGRLMGLVDDLGADVAAQTTVIASAETLLQNLAAQLAAAGTDPVKLQAIKDALDANTGRLAAAVAANTPGAPPSGPIHTG